MGTLCVGWEAFALTNYFKLQLCLNLFVYCVLK